MTLRIEDSCAKSFALKEQELLEAICDMPDSKLPLYWCLLCGRELAAEESNNHSYSFEHVSSHD